MIYQFRKEPMSIYMRNTSEAGRDRQVLYVKGKYGDKMHVSTGAGDNAFVGVGFKITISPDDPRALEKSRFSIRDAGFGRGINNFTQTVEKIESGRLPPDTLKYLGPTQRQEYPYPLEAVAQTAARLNRWEFFLAVSPLAVATGTGSAYRSTAFC